MVESRPSLLGRGKGGVGAEASQIGIQETCSLLSHSDHIWQREMWENSLKIVHGPESQTT